MEKTQYIQCPRCGENVPVDKNICPNCKKIFLKTGPASTPQKLTDCPICKIPIYPGKMNEFDILHCAECGGTAYKREVLMKMRANDEKKLETGEQEKEHQTPPYFEKRDRPPFLICPYCGKKMETKRLGPMQVDVCGECKALFLDGDKYRHINAILGAYKLSMMNDSENSGRRPRR